MGDRIKKEIYSWAIVLLIVLVLRVIFVEAYVIPTGSMEETLRIGDAVLVNRFIYGIKFPIPLTGIQIPVLPGRDPQRGEIVVFKYPFENRDFVKRCVAIEGDTVEIIDKVLFVNRTRINEAYVRHLDRRNYDRVTYDMKRYQEIWERSQLYDVLGFYIRDNFGPVVVPEDCIFVMGDNRDNSHDSRFWGPLHKKHLKGKPLFIYFSFDPGREVPSLLEILKVWQWKEIRLRRIGKVT